jgi:three-Cys-motif partner protein
LPGSPLIAVWAAKPFSQVVLVEKDPRMAAACRARTATAGLPRHTVVLEGDSNELVHSVVQHIPRGALTLAFVDPEALDARWETVATLSAAGRVDLLLLFADAYDAIRNLDNFLSGDDPRLDQVMGPYSRWRDDVRALPNWEGNTLRQFFAEEYIALLKRHLGYVVSGTKIIRGPSGPLYRLIYASKHDRGLDFWNKVDFRDRHGQSGLFGP